MTDEAQPWNPEELADLINRLIDGKRHFRIWVRSSNRDLIEGVYIGQAVYKLVTTVNYNDAVWRGSMMDLDVGVDCYRSHLAVVISTLSGDFAIFIDPDTVYRVSSVPSGLPLISCRWQDHTPGAAL